jgi:hypothetical protein
MILLVKRDPGEGFPGSMVARQQLIWAGSGGVKRRRGLGACNAFDVMPLHVNTLKGLLPIMCLM